METQFEAPNSETFRIEGDQVVLRPMSSRAHWVLLGLAVLLVVGPLKLFFLPFPVPWVAPATCTAVCWLLAGFLLEGLRRSKDAWRLDLRGLTIEAPGSLPVHIRFAEVHKVVFQGNLFQRTVSFWDESGSFLGRGPSVPGGRKVSYLIASQLGERATIVAHGPDLAVASRWLLAVGGFVLLAGAACLVTAFAPSFRGGAATNTREGNVTDAGEFLIGSGIFLLAGSAILGLLRKELKLQKLWPYRRELKLESALLPHFAQLPGSGSRSFCYTPEAKRFRPVTSFLLGIAPAAMMVVISCGLLLVRPEPGEPNTRISGLVFTLISIPYVVAFILTYKRFLADIVPGLEDRLILNERDVQVERAGVLEHVQSVHPPKMNALPIDSVNPFKGRMRVEMESGETRWYDPFCMVEIDGRTDEH